MALYVQKHQNSRKNQNLRLVAFHQWNSSQHLIIFFFPLPTQLYERGRDASEQIQIESQIFPILRIHIATPFFALYCFAHQAASTSSIMDTLVEVQGTPLEPLHPLAQ